LMYNGINDNVENSEGDNITLCDPEFGRERLSMYALLARNYGVFVPEIV